MVQASDTTLGKLLSPTEVFVVPVYQRPYVWSQERNWQPLWEDVARATAVWRDAHDAGLDAPTHFLGSVVLQQKRKEPGRVSASWVIDGQQRLTTLSVLIAAARAVASRAGEAEIAGLFATMVTNQQQAVSSKHPEDRSKVWPLRLDAEAYVWAVRPPDQQEQPGPGDHRLVQARQFFEEAIESWACGEPDTGALDAATGADARGDRTQRLLADLQFTLDQQLQVVQVVLGTQDDPQVIFEALNYRGVPLDAADLVKNQLFMKLDQQGDHEQADDLLAHQWLPLDGGVWREQITTGRVKRARVDLLLAHWLVIKTRNEVVVDHLYAGAKQWLGETDARAAELIRDVRSHADAYDRLTGMAAGGSALSRLIDRMEGHTTTPWPLLLFLHHHPGVPAEQSEIAARAIDSFLMRRAVLNLTTKDYNRLFVQVLAAAQDADADRAGVAVQRALLEQTADSRRWPDDDETLTALAQSPLFRVMYRARLKALLAGINNDLYSGRDDTRPYLSARDKLTVEHVLPQKWEKHWALPATAPKEVLDRRHSHIHRLGNLTLVTGRLNPSLSHGSWGKKRPALQKHGLLKITSSTLLTLPDGLEGFAPDDWPRAWDEDRIDARSHWLARRALHVWPRPAVTADP